MESIDLRDQVEGILKEAEDALGSGPDGSVGAVCRTLIACTRALCIEIASVRHVVESIDTELTSIDDKMPDQN